jgi:ParB-like chromosome segregation protein Spo0J
MTDTAVVNQLELVAIGQIKPYHRNARKHDATVERLIELIPKVGFNVPLVLDRQNVIVKGHARWKAAVRLGMTALPCVFTDASQDQIRLDRLADNKVQEFSAWDQEALASEIAAINFDFSLPSLDFKVAALAVTATAAVTNGAGGEGFISQDDIDDTVHRPEHDFSEVFCPQCGKAALVRRS